MKPPLGGNFEGMDGRRTFLQMGFCSPRDQRILGADSETSPVVDPKIQGRFFGFGKH